MRYYEQQEKPQYYDYIGITRRINTFNLFSQIVLLIAFAAILFLPVFKGEILIDTEATEITKNTEENKTTTIEFSYFDDMKSFVKAIIENKPMELDDLSFGLNLLSLVSLVFLEIAVLCLANNIFLCIYRIYRPKKEALLKYHRIKTLGFVKEHKDPRQSSAFICFAFLYSCFPYIIVSLLFTKSFSTVPLPLDAISIRKMPYVTGVTQLAWVIPALFLLFIIIKAFQRHFESSMTILVRGEKERRFEKFTRHYSLEK